MYRMSTPEGQSIYSKRKSTVEPVIRCHQTGGGIPEISPERIQCGAGRMESGVHGLELEASVCMPWQPEKSDRERCSPTKSTFFVFYQPEKACLGRKVSVPNQKSSLESGCPIPSRLC